MGHCPISRSSGQLPRRAACSCPFSLHPARRLEKNLFLFFLELLSMIPETDGQICFKVPEGGIISKPLPTPPTTGARFLRLCLPVSLAPLSPGASHAAAAAKARSKHPFARQLTNLSSQRVRPKLPPRMRSNAAFLRKNHIYKHDSQTEGGGRMTKELFFDSKALMRKKVSICSTGKRARPFFPKFLRIIFQ